MRLVLPMLLASLTLLGGCSEHPDKDSVGILLNEYAKEVTGKVRSHVRDWPKDEREVRYFAEYHGDEHDVLDDFLMNNPNLSPKVTTLITEMRDASAELEKMHQSLIEEDRYVLTDEEKSLRGQLQEIGAANLIRLSELVDP